MFVISKASDKQSTQVKYNSSITGIGYEIPQQPI